MGVLPTDPVYSYLLLCSLEPKFQPITKQITAIVAMLSVENVFYSSGKQEL